MGLLLAVHVAACSSGKENSSSKGDNKTTNVVGIHPQGYKCEDLVTVAEVADALGGKVDKREVAFSPPPGTAEPCHYIRTIERMPEVNPDGTPKNPDGQPDGKKPEDNPDGKTGDPPEEAKPVMVQEPWSFDMDCREDALKTADALFEQYKAKPMNDAGAVTNETGLVQIGRKAMDHHGQALIIVDDDTDCYLRVMGPASEGRLALGKLLTDKLVLKNAPMKPRPAE